VARIKRNLDNLPTICNRLPCLRDLPPIAAARAAKQLRPIGQLAFQWRFPRIHALVRDVLWTLAGRDHRGDEDMAVDPSRGLKIIQVGSVCGGTNAGMLIDQGYLVRSELEALGTLGDACTVIGMGMLPGAFRGVDGPNLVPNTVASLMELESVTMDGNLPLTYRDGTVVEPARPPFDMYLLVDAVDEGGRVWVSRDDLCRMVARAILVLAATRLGEQSEGELDNLDEVLSQRTPDGHGTFFGSLGLAAREGLVREVMDRVEAHIEHIGIGRALEELTTYCTPTSGDDDLTRELKRLVRDYAEMLRANARVAGGRA
ncbi:MAG: tubulin-like doman-containing protein, partial [Anaerolineae bacterium]